MNIVEIKEKDIPHAATVLTTAFVNDPIFRYIFRSEEHYYKAAPWLFGTWIRWAIMYGKAWQSADGNAVVLLRSPENPGMSLWTMIRAGMLPTPYKLGWPAFKRFYFEIVALLDKKHAEVIGKTPHWYGWMVGASEPGRGMGRAVLNHCTTIADELGLPIFLETATPANLALYNAKDFEIRDEARVSDDCTIYFLVRPPLKARDVAFSDGAAAAAFTELHIDRKEQGHGIKKVPEGRLR